jgi:hypothetical protein
MEADIQQQDEIIITKGDKSLIIEQVDGRTGETESVTVALQNVDLFIDAIKNCANSSQHMFI